MGWGGIDCSLVVLLTTPIPTEAAPTQENTIKMEKKETPYGKVFRFSSCFFIPIIHNEVIVFCQNDRMCE